MQKLMKVSKSVNDMREEGKLNSYSGLDQISRFLLTPHQTF
jgi:hypothetical protein